MWITGFLATIWLAAAVALGIGWQPGTYLSLILVWGLPPVMFQTAFGADILWGYRRLILPGILVPTLYLGMADALAIRAGIWTISPDQTTGVLLPFGLPLEEFVFFLMTNLLIAFGVVLVLAQRSQERVPPGVLGVIDRVIRF
jgi:lycopene cyclase domain-containing protein